MMILTKKLILEEPTDEIVKPILVEDSLVKDEPVIEEPLINEPEVESTSVIGSDFGIASMLNAGIIDEFEAIEFYNSHIATVKSVMAKEKDETIIESCQKILEILVDIVNEEHIHVGQLQKALNLVSPSVSFYIDKGKQEADEVIDSQEE